MRTLSAALPVALLALAGCQSSQNTTPAAAAPARPSTVTIASANPPPHVRTFMYQCDELDVTARFIGQDKVELAFGGNSLELPIAISADGARYADDRGDEFWGKGLQDAMFTLAGQKMRSCKGSGQEVGGDGGAEGGVAYATDQSGTLSTQFHANGNEPGWMAEVTLAAQPSMQVQLNYGERKLDVSKLLPTNDGWSGEASDGTRVLLSYKRTPCQDSMSGAKAPTTVTLVAGDASLHGCGGFRTP